MDLLDLRPCMLNTAWHLPCTYLYRAGSHDARNCTVEKRLQISTIIVISTSSHLKIRFLQAQKLPNRQVDEVNQDRLKVLESRSRQCVFQHLFL